MAGSCKTRRGNGREREIGEHEFDSAFNARSTAFVLLRIIVRAYTYVYVPIRTILDHWPGWSARGEVGRASETRNFLRPLSLSLSHSRILRSSVITTVFIRMLINIYQLFFFFFFIILFLVENIFILIFVKGYLFIVLFFSLQKNK